MQTEIGFPPSSAIAAPVPIIATAAVAARSPASFVNFMFVALLSFVPVSGTAFLPVFQGFQCK